MFFLRKVMEASESFFASLCFEFHPNFVKVSSKLRRSFLEFCRISSSFVEVSSKFCRNVVEWRLRRSFVEVSSMFRISGCTLKAKQGYHEWTSNQVRVITGSTGNAIGTIEPNRMEPDLA